MILPFWLSNFSMLPWCLIHPSRVLLAESSNIRYTQWFYITVYPSPSYCDPVCIQPSFYLKKVLKISFSMEIHTNTQFTTRKWRCGSGDVEVGLSKKNKFFHYQLSPELFSPHRSHVHLMLVGTPTSIRSILGAWHQV